MPPRPPTETHATTRPRRCPWTRGDCRTRAPSQIIGYIRKRVLGSSSRHLQHSLRTRTENTMGFIYRFVFPGRRSSRTWRRGVSRQGKSIAQSMASRTGSSARSDFTTSLQTKDSVLSNNRMAWIMALMRTFSDWKANAAFPQAYAGTFQDDPSSYIHLQTHTGASQPRVKCCYIHDNMRTTDKRDRYRLKELAPERVSKFKHLAVICEHGMDLQDHV